jgi:hypothetical protein
MVSFLRRGLCARGARKPCQYESAAGRENQQVGAARTDRNASQKGAAARFIDLRTLAFALTDQPYGLERACKAFGDQYEKPEVEYDRITPELIEYAFEDVRQTSLLYRNALAELARHGGVDLEPHRLYLPATVGARYLEAMGVTRPLEKFTSLTDHQLGWDSRGRDQPRAGAGDAAGIGEEVLGVAVSAFYGGRAEARIVRTPVPVVHVDRSSSGMTERPVSRSTSSAREHETSPNASRTPSAGGCRDRHLRRCSRPLHAPARNTNHWARR